MFDEFRMSWCFSCQLASTAGGVKPLANNFDGAESATADGQAGNLLAQYESNGFAIAFLIRGGEFFGLLWREPVQQVQQIIRIAEPLEAGLCALGKLLL